MLRLELITCNQLLATHAQQRSYSILQYAKRKALLTSVSGWYGSNGKPPRDLNPCPIVIDAITHSMSCSHFSLSRSSIAFWVIYPQFCIFLAEKARNIVGMCHRQPNHYFQSVDNL